MFRNRQGSADTAATAKSGAALVPKAAPRIPADVRAHVELAVAPPAGGALLLIGWLFDPNRRVRRIFLQEDADAIPPATERRALSGMPGVRRVSVSRPDVTAAVAGSGSESTSDHQHGFALFLPAGSGNALGFELENGAVLSVPFTRTSARVDVIEQLGARWSYLGDPLRELASGWQADAWLDECVRSTRVRGFASGIESVARLHEEPGVLHAVIDEALALGPLGLVISGWFHAPAIAPRAVSVVTPEGEAHDVTTSWVRLYREDVLARVGRPRDRQENLGFLGVLPLPTARGELRLLRFDLGSAGERWLRLPTERIAVPGAALAQEILGRIRAPERLRAQLFGIFDSGLGHFLERLVAAEGSRAPAAVLERQFGTPPAAPTVSIVVPLYGRFDFVRHQLAQFAADVEFEHIDLIYVIDDPSIAAAAIDHGAHYYPMFGRAFRMLSYERNLGFAGANNLGVRHARADTVVLLNSDVIPQQPGWVGALQRGLGTLPQAGLVGPLLEFHDGGVQHAGMVARRDPSLPGFVMNAHPGKGQPWRGGEEPLPQQLMTGACMCLRKADYLEAGGLDEGYLVGDFEDSDLCMALRARGQRAWLIPTLRMWHLERQSQHADGAAGQRQLLTLYNAWRYRRRIVDGVIADPEA